MGYSVWSPEYHTTLKLLMSIRITSAMFSTISDCDEVYNYWEPAHQLIYGSGFQTWEYSPVYALRSYLYIWFHIGPFRLLADFFPNNRLLIFYCIRAALAVICATTELALYAGVIKRFGPNVARLMLVFLLLSPGLFNAAPAFLPSTFALILTTFALAAWFFYQYNLVILCVACSTFIGWPFAALLGIPFAIHILFVAKEYKVFITFSLLSVAIFLLPLIMIDSAHYGKLVIPPLNIIMYNVFGSLSGMTESASGSELYGTEPFSFYFINGFLNFNVAFPLALLSMPLTIYFWPSSHMNSSSFSVTHHRWALSIPSLCLYIWCLVFFFQPHKEERFLFPIYSIISLCAALSLDSLQKYFTIILRTFRSTKPFKHYTLSSIWLVFSILTIFILLSFSRLIQIHRAYHGALDIWVQLPKIASDKKIHTLSSTAKVNLCIGKEWYRYPSSFFLPNANWNLRFIRSEFRGQLPKPYAKGQHATRLIPTHMNHLNKEEPTRYTKEEFCHYLIDFDAENVMAKDEPRYALMTDRWKVILSHPFMDTQRSSKFFRSFYIPIIGDHFIRWGNYTLLQSRLRSKKRIKY